jgi:predicted nucleic acid-binding protein
LEEEKLEKIIIDTYALMAIVYDEVSDKAREILESIRRGEIKGLIPVTVVYEYVIHWLRGRIIAFKNIDEVITYLKTYFRIINLDVEDYVRAAQIKVLGEEYLRSSNIEELKSRSLSFTDSTILALAEKLEIPILTNDKDLCYVALKMGVKTLW